MKIKLSIIGICILLLAAVAFTTATPQQGNGKDKSQQQDKPKQNPKSKKPDKSNPGINDNNGQPGNNGKKDNPGNKGADENNGNNGNKGKNNDLYHGNRSGKDGYIWDPISFKERHKFKNQEKVTICHKFNHNNGDGVVIRVSSNALKAHLNHGDITGECPVFNNRYSRTFIRNRTDYYNNLEDHYEQVVYSQSILDYALLRLADSRQQLVIMQQNNMPVAEIERRQSTVVVLEENVTLLQRLLGIAAEIVVDKFL